ncbi:MAG TPA: hypothetical protein VG870_08095 [Chitinophagaceae bacterium]|nr:hypothetical protein [Chitinophagaceae bacterium]
MKWILAGAMLLALVTPGCQGRSDRTRGLRDDLPLYADYQVWGEEHSDSITMLFQFHEGYPSGPARELADPARIDLDGRSPVLGSARLTGAYYELRLPADSFEGKHVITLTLAAGKAFRDTFSFASLRLTQEIPDTIRRTDLKLDLAGLDQGDILQVVATDTSFRSRDINQSDTIGQLPLRLTREQLGNLVSGPVSLELYREKNQILGSGDRVSRYLAQYYVIRRQVFLVGTP